MAKKPKVTPRKTMRIYYGTGKTRLYWTVRVNDAKKDVVVKGTLMDAITGTPGETIGCHLSNCANNNADAFPHPCIFPAFNKSRCAIVDKVTNGSPSHAVRYVHKYGKLVDLNDTDKTRAAIRKNPDLAETSFVLRAPKGLAKKGARHRGSNPRGKDTGSNAHVVPRGALARARKAGLITADLERVLRKETATSDAGKHA